MENLDLVIYTSVVAVSFIVFIVTTLKEFDNVAKSGGSKVKN
jgi:hypothetical protein